MINCNKESIIERIKEFKNYTGMSQNLLAGTIGMEQVTLNRQLNGQRGLSIEVIIGILANFSEVSAEWLLRDRGDMFISKFAQTPESIELKYNERLERLVDTVATLQDIINIKDKDFDDLYNKYKALQARIAELEQKSK